LLVATFQINPTSLREVVIPVGNVTAELSNDVPHAIVGVPAEAVKEIHSFCPFTGVPVRPDVIDVMFAA
jgi:hypothetical protein